MKNILLTGKPGVGKTTAIRRIVDELKANTTAGFWSTEIRENGRRVGFGIETLSGKTGVLAHVNIQRGPRVSKYRVNVEAINSIVVPELKAARESGKAIIIDEIATMELFSQQFLDEVNRCLNTKRVVGTIQYRRSHLLDEIKSRNDVEILELTLHNRDRIPTYVLGLLKQ
ncbi:MAG: NTPase [Candidatus Thorarchaeota archaeon]|nr:NTPase [Candidatus Thorarchaeota archaeon]